MVMGDAVCRIFHEVLPGNNHSVKANMDSFKGVMYFDRHICKQENGSGRDALSSMCSYAFQMILVS